MSQTNNANDALKEILNILSLISENSKDALEFNLDDFTKIEIRKKFKEISFFSNKKLFLMKQTNYTYILSGKFMIFLNH